MNNDMPKNLQRWEKVRQKGQAKFIVQYGIFVWGLLMFVLMTFLVSRRHYPLTAVVILASACSWAVAGAIVGWFVWRISEKRYQKFLAQRGAPEHP